MPADSLKNMARRACVKFSRQITDIGDAPLELVRPILLKINHPEQLHTLEQNCPQLIGETREIWLNMIKRDIPDYETKPHEPSDPKNWYKVYRKLKHEAERENAAGNERLKAALSIAQEKKGPTTRIVTQDRVPRQPVRRRQAIVHDYLSGRTGSKGSHKLSLIDRIRKESRGASSAKMSRPTHELQKRANGVVKPPSSFVREIKQQNVAKMPLAEAREALGYASSKASKAPSRPPGTPYDLTQDREARLRSLKAGKAVGRETGGGGSEGVNRLTLDFLEDEEDDDELFGISSGTRPNPAKRKISPPPTSGKRKGAPNLFITNQTKRKRPNPGVT